MKVIDFYKIIHVILNVPTRMEHIFIKITINVYNVMQIAKNVQPGIKPIACHVRTHLNILVALNVMKIAQRENSQTKI